MGKGYLLSCCLALWPQAPALLSSVATGSCSQLQRLRASPKYHQSQRSQPALYTLMPHVGP